MAIPDETVSKLKLTRDELTKVNLFHSMLFTFFREHPNSEFEDAIITIVDFYAQIGKGRTGFFRKLSLSQNPSNSLEQIISARISESNSIFKTNSSLVITYALLYVDILAFRIFLKSPRQLKSYVQELESTIVSCSFLALTSKKKKNKSDKQLLELFESSSDYLIEPSNSKQIFTLEGIQYLTKKDGLEKRYLMDLCILAVNDDHNIDDSEFKFLQQLAVLLELSDEDLQLSIQDLKYFAEANSTKIQLFEYSNPINQFYKQSTKTVKTLIIRNKDRLTKELEESGELVLLFGQSAIRDLNHEEKAKVKEQLTGYLQNDSITHYFLIAGGNITASIIG